MMCYGHIDTHLIHLLTLKKKNGTTNQFVQIIKMINFARQHLVHSITIWFSIIFFN